MSATNDVLRKGVLPREAVDLYIGSCQARGLSYSTITGIYRPVLEHSFLPWLEDEWPVTTRTAERFSSYLQTRKPALAAESVRSYLRVVRTFCRWLEQENLGGSIRVPLPRATIKVRSTPARQDISRMLEGRPLRDVLLIELMANCGLRLSEVIHLRPADIQKDGLMSSLLVKGKGRRERLVPVPPGVAKHLKAYLASHENLDTLFCEVRSPYRPLTKSGVYQVVRKAAGELGIPNVSPHGLRRSFITQALRSGVDPLLLAKIAGHSLAVMMASYDARSNADGWRAISQAFQ